MFSKLISIVEGMKEEEARKKAPELSISIEESKELLEREKEAELLESIRLRNIQKDEDAIRFTSRATDLGTSLGLSAPCLPVYIINVRMLHSKGSGHGSARKTVIHLKLLGDYRKGRLKRDSGELLCGQGYSYELSEQDFSVSLSCPKCLKILNRE